MFDAFQPDRGTNQNVTTGAASASVTVKADSKSIRFTNSGNTNPCHVRVGIGSQTATTADMVINPLESIVCHKADGENTVAYLQSGGATTLHIITGEGG